MKNPVYKIQELTKEYEGRTVIDHLSLSIKRGEVFAVVGPSGAGKSTFLRMLNFLEPPTTGRIIFDGREFSSGSEMPLDFRRRVTTVFQHPMLLNQSVWENVTYGLRLRGNLRSNGSSRAVLDEIGLTKLATQNARTLSGGEAQRVALARAMIIRPDVLLLDEPTANLDPYNIGLIEDFVRKTNQVNQTSVVLVTHNIFQARRLAHRVALMLEGKIVEVAANEIFFKAPRDPRTTAFVRGDMVY
jgi:tungstate transport system ATP-binding protein